MARKKNVKHQVNSEDVYWVHPKSFKTFDVREMKNPTGPKQWIEDTAILPVNKIRMLKLLRFKFLKKRLPRKSKKWFKKQLSDS